MACSLRWSPPCQHYSLAGQEHGRTIPLPDMRHRHAGDWCPTAFSTPRDGCAPQIYAACARLGRVEQPCRAPRVTRCYSSVGLRCRLGAHVAIAEAVLPSSWGTSLVGVCRRYARTPHLLTQPWQTGGWSGASFPSLTEAARSLDGAARDATDEAIEKEIIGDGHGHARNERRAHQLAPVEDVSADQVGRDAERHRL